MSRIVIITPPPPPPPPGGRAAALSPAEHLRLAAAQLDAEEAGQDRDKHGYKVGFFQRIHNQQPDDGA